jgi:hypothetical protein
MQNRELLALPDWSAVPSNSAEDCHLLNQRIAYFGAVMFWLSLAFFLFSFAVPSATQGSRRLGGSARADRARVSP